LWDSGAVQKFYLNSGLVAIFGLFLARPQAGKPAVRRAKGEKMEAHYYLISRKRGHTNAVRIRDHIGQVIADKAFPPFVKGSAKMSKVDWWHNGPPNTVCTPTDCGLPASDSLSTPAAISG